ncbi:hypothetical protein [Aureimonas sp. Leaf324]|jgi:hypothetical protein|uniref:hypothetical protein n=1 Tax=Aureimonas sp. Leaf324 TaxID=1736336 RepID=UPI0006F3FBBF|nr:hypothetical protein [Aureimonas sp. Leaf324]KQQ90335.1 hypothetical protein ASF65_15945 [Aureimonas sp. Leaf324]
MFVVRMDYEDVRKFQAFRSVVDARAHARRCRQEDDLGEVGIRIFDVPDTTDAEIAVMAVRDGLGIPVGEAEPDAALILASMGLGTGLRI